MAKFDYDLFVIGAGSGGVRAARVAAAHGAKVAIAEEYRVGGTCVIRGCVPKKMLVYGAHFAEDLNSAEHFGWAIKDRAFNWQALRNRVQADVDRLNKAYSQTLDNHRVDTFLDRAVLKGPNEVELAGGRTIAAKYILIATGGWPARPQFSGAELGITSNEIFHLDDLPKRMVISGGGYIANEFAGIFHAFGTEVTLINRSSTILRGYDEQIRERLLQISQMKGIRFRFNCEFTQLSKQADGRLSAQFAAHDPISDVDVTLFAIGRRPHSDGLGLDVAGVMIDANGAIKVDGHGRTSCPSIYAVGDVTDRIQLTPVAIREGQAFADTLFGGKPSTVDYANVPAAVFSDPPLAGVGLTENEARNTLSDVKIFSSDFRAMKDVLAGREQRSLYKLVVDASNDRVVGLHMIGPDAPEILQAAAIAVKAGLSKADFDATVALHPSMAEELVLMR